jgi:hypothetical protein
MKSKIIASVVCLLDSGHEYPKSNYITMSKKLFYLFVLIFITSFANAQGCSDAGICSIGHGFQPEEKILKNNVEVATIFGAGEADVTYVSPYVSYTRRISNKFSLSSKITFSSAKGSFGTRAAFGDGFLVGNYTFDKINSKQWSTTFGAKFPFTNSNQKINGFSLPLDYQASLGTFDLFFGTNLNYKNWDFNAVVQLPKILISKNSLELMIFPQLTYSKGKLTYWFELLIL